MEVLAGEVRHHREQGAAPAAQIVAELRDAEVIAGELGLELERRAGALVEVMVLGREVEDAALGHG